METFNLTKPEACWNPYCIAGKKVESIVFYSATGEICRSNKGWTQGSNNNRDSTVESLEFTRRAKVNLTRGEHFFIRDVVYIYAPRLAGVINLGEKVASSNDNESWLGHFIVYSTKRKQEKFPSLHEIMVGCYTTKTLTAKGELLEQLAASTKKHARNLSGWELERITKDPECVQLINELAKLKT